MIMKIDNMKKYEKIWKIWRNIKTGINKYELLVDGGVDFIPSMND